MRALFMTKQEGGRGALTTEVGVVRVAARVWCPSLAAVCLLLSGCTSSMSAASLVRNQELERQQTASVAAPVPDDRKLYLSLIQEMQSKGMFYASLAHVDAFEKKYGVQPDIELLRADALRETSQQEAALVVYRSLLTSNVAARAQHGIGRALASEHKMGEATLALSAAVRLDPTNIDFLNDLGFAFLASGNVPGARIPIAQAAELAPNNKKVLANLVLYLLLTGQVSAADQVAATAKLPDATLRATRALAAQLGTPPPLAMQQEVPQVQEVQQVSQVQDGQQVQQVSKRDSSAPIAAASVPAALAWQSGTVLQRFGDAK